MLETYNFKYYEKFHVDMIITAYKKFSVCDQMLSLFVLCEIKSMNRLGICPSLYGYTVILLAVLHIRRTQTTTLMTREFPLLEVVPGELVIIWANWRERKGRIWIMYLGLEMISRRISGSSCLPLDGVLIFHHVMVCYCSHFLLTWLQKRVSCHKIFFITKECFYVALRLASYCTNLTKNLICQKVYEFNFIKIFCLIPS